MSKKDKTLADYGAEIAKYASKLSVSEILVLSSAGLYLGIRAVATAFDKSKQKYTHNHYVDAKGNLVWSDEMWLDNQHACDGKYLKILVDLPTEWECQQFVNTMRSLNNGNNETPMGSPGDDAKMED